MVDLDMDLEIDRIEDGVVFTKPCREQRIEDKVDLLRNDIDEIRSQLKAILMMLKDGFELEIRDSEYRSSRKTK